MSLLPASSNKRPASRLGSLALDRVRLACPFACSCLGGIPGLPIDDRRMLARVASTLVVDFADIERVRENPVNVAAAEGTTAKLAVGRGDVEFGGKPKAFQFGLDQADALEIDVEPKDGSDGFGLGLVDDEGAVLAVVADRDPAAHPHALFLRGGNLVSDALPGHLALELGEREQDIEGQPPHRCGGIELLGDGY